MQFMEPRSFRYRNAERTNLVLEPVRLSNNRNDKRLNGAWWVIVGENG